MSQQELVIRDFKNKNQCVSFETPIQLWENKIAVSISFPEEGDQDACLRQHISSINEYLLWLENNKSKLENFLLEDNFVELANLWVSSADEAEDEDQECYILEDGQKIFLPVSSEDFIRSLQPTYVNLSYEDEENSPMIYMYFKCIPDYFLCHTINLCIDQNKNFRYTSLEG